MRRLAYCVINWPIYLEDCFTIMSYVLHCFNSSANQNLEYYARSMIIYMQLRCV